MQPFIRNLEYYFLKGHFYKHDKKTFLPPISFDNVDFRRLTVVLRHLTHNLPIAKKERTRYVICTPLRSHVAKKNSEEKLYIFGMMAFPIHSYKKRTLYM